MRRDPARRILLTSGPSDAEAARQIATGAREALGALAAAVPDLGEFDLHELRAIIARAAVYIGGDSGPLHVAATTTVPVVALLGPTLPERSKPWRDPRATSSRRSITRCPAAPATSACASRATSAASRGRAPTR